jgi:hypothetical protein
MLFVPVVPGDRMEIDIEVLKRNLNYVAGPSRFAASHFMPWGAF